MKPVSCARMYTVDPAAGEPWRELFAAVTERAGVELEFIEYPAPLPLAEMWSRPDLGMTFICGWPFFLAGSRHEVLAAPVPSGPEYGGLPRYFTHFLVSRDSRYQSLEETFGGVLAFTVEDSHSGYNALRHHLLAHRRADRATLYSRIDGPNHGYHLVLEAIISGRVDVGPVDSLSWDLLCRFRPDLTDEVRIVATTTATPIPLLVASPGMDTRQCHLLRQALLSAPEYAAGLLDRVCLAGFATPDISTYQVHQARADEALRAGYARLV